MNSGANGGNNQQFMSNPAQSLANGFSSANQALMRMLGLYTNYFFVFHFPGCVTLNMDCAHLRQDFQ